MKWIICLIILFSLYILYKNVECIESISIDDPFYIQSFLLEEDFYKIVEDFKNRSKMMKTENLENVVLRQNMFVPYDSVVYDIIYK